MKSVILIAIVLMIGWYGNSLYKQNRLPFIHNSGADFESGTHLKCITKDGSVIYGDVPQGTTCERMEPVNGSLTIVPSEFFTSQVNGKNTVTSPAEFSCDGRIYCTQMRSCEEATFFTRYCPDTKMDGNHDGIPCEKQWCKG